MKVYKVKDIVAYLGLFLDDEVEADSKSEAMEIIQNEIEDNIGNYIFIELEEVVKGENENE